MNSAVQPLQPSVEPKSVIARPPIVIVGNGPVGMRVASELLERLPDQPVVIFGDEPHEPYNRVRLSSWLAGDIAWSEIAQPLRRSPGSHVDERVGYRVVGIDRAQRLVHDVRGQAQAYHKLVLATGSTSFVPAVPGIDMPGVFTFRDLDDTNRLIARRARSHHTVVIGGGLLGLEAARGMQRANTRVTVIEHADRLLGQQLDEAGSSVLQEQVEAMGIRVMLEDGLAEVLGRGRVEGIRLRSGAELGCDTVVVAAGIRPNLELARSARLAFGRGVRVDDRMRTSDPDIYAVGECAEHRDRVYGLVAPGLEQAAVAAADIAGMEGHYGGSVAASRLKVVGTPVFSMGPMGAGEDPLLGRSFVFRDPEHHLYRKILVHRHRLVGAIGIGAWDETLRLQTTIGRARRIWPWQVLRFVQSGRIWPAEDSRSVAAWPAANVVCQCTGVTRGTIGEAIALGACDADAVTAATGAGGVCGSCRPLVNELLGGDAPLPAAPLHRSLLTGGLLALAGVLVFAFAPPIPYAASVQHGWHWDQLWRDGLLKQISGFSVLGLALVALLISLRKRTPLLDRLGGFDAWRLVHIVLGVLVVAGLIAHTGFRLGSGLNLLLMVSFGLMLLLGAASSGVIALEHRVGGALAQRLRRRSVWLHILLFWPVPALLGWHVFKTYWF